VSVPDPDVTLHQAVELGAASAYYTFTAQAEKTEAQRDRTTALCADLVEQFKAEGATVQMCRGAVDLVEQAWQRGYELEWCRWAN
jgi:hypothetical protein